YNESNRAALFSFKQLTLLAPKGFAPSELIANYESEVGATVTVVEYTDIKDLIEKLWDEPIDLIAFRSADAEDVTDLLAVLDRKKIKNLNLVSVDFKNLPYDEDNKFSVPFFWGIEKKRDFSKSRLWIESIGVTQISKNKDIAYEFINYFLEPEVVIKAIKLRKVASTNRSIEDNSNIQSKWKPSYIRKIPIRNFSFQAAR